MEYCGIWEIGEKNMKILVHRIKYTHLIYNIPRYHINVINNLSMLYLISVRISEIHLISLKFLRVLTYIVVKVLLENVWNSKQMITEGEAATIPLETTLHAFRNQEKTKQRSTIAMSMSFLHM